ncbi:MAG: hypothetical protein LBH69_05460 [Methanomassiliicoccaceae archaeon]|jgi:hypothetical protein|nr:hypothetical protein [Methanomassiliicoccaceae archaeon]
MRRVKIVTEELAERLEERFGRNEPIFVKDIAEAWSEYSQSSVYQLIRLLCEDGTLMKDIPGVYYLPADADWMEGTLSLDTMKIVERRYMKNRKGKVLGYYSGQTLMNMVGLSNQVPAVDEIVTMNESTRIRRVSIGKARFILRRAKIEINEKNAPVMQLLEIFNQYDKPLARYQQENLIALARGKIDKEVLKECAKYFPRRALQNLKRSEVYDVLAQ